ncbi:MAG: SPOR domain-containing protein [Desulfuromonadaceae bacterium]|nr:SPOR domain-containing protein [Desulfuromonadaceae bacterium]
MDFKISNDSGGSQPQEAHGEKKNQSALLVLLLILVGGFTYLYFFTDLIKPQETQKVAEAPAPVPQVVKMHLPAREGEPAGAVGKSPEKTDGSNAAATAPVTKTGPSAGPDKQAPAPAVKASSAPTAKTTPAPAAKTAPAPIKVKDKTQKALAAKPADKKSLPVKGVIKKPVSVGQVKPKAAIKAKKATSGPWSVLVGNYVLEETLSADMGRVRKAGFKPVIKPSTRKKTSMRRLFVSEYDNRAAAQSSLEKISRYTSDAFVIEQGGKFALYAGSYLQSEAADFEKDRLKSAGFTVTIKYADIAIPSQNLSVGPFKSKKEADAALGRLKNTGIRAKLLQK